MASCLADGQLHARLLRSLSHNSLGAEGAAALAPALAANGSLTELNIAVNTIKDEGITVICNAVQGNKETKLASLDVVHNYISPVGATAVAAMVAVTGALTECDLRFNPRIGEEGEALIRKAWEGKDGFRLHI